MESRSCIRHSVPFGATPPGAPSLSDTRGSRVREKPRRHGAVKIKKKKQNRSVVFAMSMHWTSGNRAEQQQKKTNKQEREGSDWKKQVCGLKKNRGKRRERRLIFLSSPTLWYDGCYAQQLCLPIKARGVCGTISQGGGRREGKNKVRKREPRHWAVTAGNGLIRIGADCVPCVDSMSPQYLGLREEPGN